MFIMIPGLLVVGAVVVLSVGDIVIGSCVVFTVGDMVIGGGVPLGSFVFLDFDFLDALGSWLSL
jgi:hypothetical protein